MLPSPPAPADARPSPDDARPAPGALLSRPSRLPVETPRDRGTWTIVFVVVMAVAVSLQEVDDLGWPMVLQVCAVASVYTALALVFGERLHIEKPLASRVLYFVLQCLVLLLMAAIFVEHRIFGVSWLFYMPLVSQSRMVFGKWGTALVCLASLGMITWHVHTLAGWDEVPGTVFAIGTAVAFVLVFTDVALRESMARAQSQRLSRELEEANRRLGEFAVQAEELSATRERARVAREIHDSVGHSLTAVNMQIEAAKAMLGRDLDRTRGALDNAQGCIRDGLAEIRRSVSALRADPLDGRDLHRALADLADASVAAGMPVRFSILGRQRPLGEATSLVLFRTAQEGLTNARKHARARQVRIELEYDPPRPGSALSAVDRPARDRPARDRPAPAERVRLRVIDDGIGARETDGGFGLLGLRERALQLDGSLSVQSTPGEGLRLEIELPTPARVRLQGEVLSLDRPPSASSSIGDAPGSGP